jgi:hypothetical protein
MTENNNLEKEYEIFRKREKIAKEKKEYSHYGLGYAWRNHRPEFTEKEKKEFEQKILQYDEEVANIIKDLKVLRKKLENNTDTTPANIEHLNQEIKALGNRCKELYNKEGFRKPSGGVFKDSSDITHWHDWGDDGGRGREFSFYELPTGSDEEGKKISIKKMRERFRKAKVKNPEQFEEMYVGNREWFWLKKPTPSKISSVVQKLKSLFQTS